MKIQLDEAELKQAMETYVNKLGMSTKGKEITVSFTAGRSGNGHSATLDISSKALSVDTPTDTPPVSSVVPFDTEDGTEASETDAREPVDATNVFA